MKRLFKIACIIVLCISLVFCFSSCQKSNNYDSEDIYLEEEYIRKGKYEAFWDIYNTLNLDKTRFLYSGDVWDTEHFSLIFSDVMIEDIPYLKYHFTLKDVPIATFNDLTIEDCYKRGLIFFSICSTEDILMYGDEYYSNALFGHLDERNAQGTVRLHEDQFILAIIIVIDGCFYTAEYYTQIL